MPYVSYKQGCASPNCLLSAQREVEHKPGLSTRFPCCTFLQTNCPRRRTAPDTDSHAFIPRRRHGSPMLLYPDARPDHGVTIRWSAWSAEPLCGGTRCDTIFARMQSRCARRGSAIGLATGLSPRSCTSPTASRAIAPSFGCTTTRQGVGTKQRAANAGIQDVPCLVVQGVLFILRA